MRDYIEEYIQWKSNHSFRAPIIYKIWVIRAVQFINKDLPEWTIGDIVRFQVHIQSQFSPVSFKFCTAILKNFVKFWFLQGIIKVSPELIKIPQISRKRMSYILEPEYQEILKKCSEDTFREIRTKLIIMLLFRTGVRVSELAGLSISDIELDKKEALVRTAKNKRFRKVFWDEATAQVLSKYLVKRKQLGENSDALFIGVFKGGALSLRLNIRSIQRDVLNVVKKSKINKKLTVHSFRHSKAHDLMDKQAPMPLISKILGHRTIASTSVYTEYDDKDFRKSARKYLRV